MQAQDEKLSLLLDDQLDSAQSLSLLKSLRDDLELQARYRRYAMISQAIKGDQCSVASLDFAEKVRQEVKQEPAYFLPQKKSAPGAVKTSLALAASVMLAVIGFSVGKYQTQPQSYVGANTLAQQALPAEQLNPKFREYLQAHDNTWYVNQNAGVKTYARLASYQPK